MAEIAFEYLALALEDDRGVAEAAPTHYAMLDGMLNPKQSRYRPSESRGTLAEFYRSQVVRKWTEWEGEAGLDNYILPVFCEMLVKGGVSPTTPAGATTTRLRTYTPSMTSDTLKTATMWWGDPNVQILQAPFCYISELMVSADASGEDGATMSLKGMGQFAEKVSAPTLPSQLVSPLIAPADMQLWIDTTTIGTTAITGRVISGEVTIPNTITPKYLAVGPGAARTYQRIGLGKRHATAKFTFELVDFDQYDMWADADILKVRWRLNGPAIEVVSGPATLYHYVEFDLYGPFDELEWGDYDGTNRTVTLSMQTEYNAGIGADWSVKIQNDRASL